MNTKQIIMVLLALMLAGIVFAVTRLYKDDARIGR